MFNGRLKRKRLTRPWTDAVELRLKGFERKNWYNGLQCLLYDSSDAQKIFDAFTEKVISAIGSHYFPVYRMADGEFLFCLGWRPPLSHRPGKRDAIRNCLIGLRKKQQSLRGFGTMWGENYSAYESWRARRIYPGLVGEIARTGMLGLYFMRRPDFWGEEYIIPMLKWFKKNNIVLSEDNYLPFYMVYAILSGPVQKDLFHDRKVLVATGLTPLRCQGIEAGLKKAGVRSIDFVSVSKSKSMFSRLDLNRIADSPDLALVGAGVGSANIIVQLKELEVPVIDAGIFLECLIDPKHRDDRPFL